MLVAASLLHQVCNRSTPKDVQRKLHRLRLQRRGTLFAHGTPQWHRCRHRFRNQSTHRSVQRAAAAAATPETSVTLMRVAVIILCSCASMLCIATIFLVKKLMHTARKFEDTLDIVNEELPGLSASARLTGLELADCIVEFSHLGQEVTSGIKAGARAMQATEASLQEGGRALKHTWTNHVVPGINERVAASKDILNHSLQSNAGLTYADGTPAHMAATTKVAIQEARKMVATMGALYQVANRGLGVLTYVSQSRPGEGSSDGDEARRPGPAAEASSYQEWTSQEFSHPAQEEANTWPPVDPQGKGPISERGPEESSGVSSADMPNSEGGDSGGGPSSAAPPR